MRHMIWAVIKDLTAIVARRNWPFTRDPLRVNNKFGFMTRRNQRLHGMFDGAQLFGVRDLVKPGKEGRLDFRTLILNGDLIPTRVIGEVVHHACRHRIQKFGRASRQRNVLLRLNIARLPRVLNDVPARGTIVVGMFFWLRVNPIMRKVSGDRERRVHGVLRFSANVHVPNSLHFVGTIKTGRSPFVVVTTWPSLNGVLRLTVFDGFLQVSVGVMICGQRVLYMVIMRLLNHFVFRGGIIISGARAGLLLVALFV